MLTQNFLSNYDFIVVGGGSTGAVIANRLSEVSSWNVLLLEAGGDETIATDIPGLVTYVQRTNIDWKYKTVPQNLSCLAFNGNRFVITSRTTFDAPHKYYFIEEFIFIAGALGHAGRFSEDHPSLTTWFTQEEISGTTIGGHLLATRGGLLTKFFPTLSNQKTIEILTSQLIPSIMGRGAI